MEIFESFEEKPYWRTDYSDGISSLLREIPLYFHALKKFAKDPANDDYVDGFAAMYYEFYTTECNRGDLDLVYSDKFRLAVKSSNVSKAINFLFEDSLIVVRVKHEFNADLAKHLHKLIGDGLFDNPGVFRKNSAKPSGYDYLYLEPSKIEEEMKKLFIDINTEIAAGNMKWFEIGGKFFERFLFIHPFANGNGRTARILLSALLSKFTIVPVCLFNVCSNTKKANDVYLDALNEAHEFKNFKLLNSFIIECTYNSLKLCVDCLDVGGC